MNKSKCGVSSRHPVQAALVAVVVVALVVVGGWRGTSAGPVILFGDANCDQDVNSIDALLVMQYHAKLLDELPCLDAADMNENGFINGLDALAILQQHAGFPSPVTSLLIDATHDGGLWWFPQGDDPSFDSDEPHQGEFAANYLRSLDMKVVELSRVDLIDKETLQDYDVVIRAGGFGPYETSEIDAYLDYVGGGGRVLLLTDHHLTSEDELTDAFGLAFRGVARTTSAALLVDRFMPHDITQGVTSLRYQDGSALIAYPPDAQILGYLCETCFVDLNDNSVRDEDEPFGPPVLGVLNYGAGAVVFLGDTNTFLGLPQPLTDNILKWLQE